MNEPANGVKKLHQPISFSDCTQYLSAKGVSLQCPSCGKTDAAIISDVSSETITIFASVMAEIDPAGGMRPMLEWRPVFQVICGSCGTYRQFDYDMLEKWVADREPEKNETQ